AIHIDAGRYGEAIALLEPTVQAALARPIQDSPHIAVFMMNLATSYDGAGRPADALKMAEQAKQRANRLPRDHEARVLASRAYAELHGELSGKPAETVSLWVEAVQGHDRLFGEDAEETRLMVRKLYVACERARQWAKLEPYADRLIADATR